MKAASFTGEKWPNALNKAPVTHTERPDRFFWATQFLFLLFPYFFVSVPCARLSWHYRQLLSARKMYRIVSYLALKKAPVSHIERPHHDELIFTCTWSFLFDMLHLVYLLLSVNLIPYRSVTFSHFADSPLSPSISPSFSHSLLKTGSRSLDLEHRRQTPNVGYHVDERRQRTSAGDSWSSRW